MASGKNIPKPELDDEWNDLPDPSEHPGVKLTQTQRMEENHLKSIVQKDWPNLYKIGVEKKQRKIIGSRK